MINLLSAQWCLAAFTARMQTGWRPPAMTLTNFRMKQDLLSMEELVEVIEVIQVIEEIEEIEIWLRCCN
jgi:hypothetical protein